MNMISLGNLEPLKRWVLELLSSSAWFWHLKLLQQSTWMLLLTMNDIHVTEKSLKMLRLKLQFLDHFRNCNFSERRWAFWMIYRWPPKLKMNYRVTKTIFMRNKCLYLFQFWSYTKILEYGKVWELYILFKPITNFWKFLKFLRSFKK